MNQGHLLTAYLSTLEVNIKQKNEKATKPNFTQMENKDCQITWTHEGNNVLYSRWSEENKYKEKSTWKTQVE